MKQRFSLASGALTFMFITQAASTGSAASNPFSDVPADHWAMQAVTKLANDGVITGYGDNTFKGDAKITRFEMAQSDNSVNISKLVFFSHGYKTVPSLTLP